MRQQVLSVSVSSSHQLAKAPAERIALLAGLGVEGDAHCGVTVKHRSRVAKDPSQPNLRQIHLLHAELFEELAAQSFTISPGQLGENITTRGVNLLQLPTGTELHVGESAIVRVTGLRNPCSQLDQFQHGLMAAVLGKNANGELVRKAGVMAVVVAGGLVFTGDSIDIKLPPAPHQALTPV